MTFTQSGSLTAARTPDVSAGHLDHLELLAGQTPVVQRALLGLVPTPVHLGIPSEGPLFTCQAGLLSAIVACHRFTSIIGP